MTSLVCPSRAPLVSAPGKARPGAISMRRAPRLIEQLRCQAKDGGGAAPGAAARTAATPPPLPPVVNWHLEARCNYACKFCEFGLLFSARQGLREACC